MEALFDKRLAVTSAAVILVAAISFVMSNAIKIPELAPINENVAGIELDNAKKRAASIPPDKEEEYEYTIKEHNGRVAVFPAKSAEPELVLDVLVKYLPDYDRAQMQDGIHVKNYEELVKLIEDYTS